MFSISVLIKGFVVGSTMMVPGVSGGSMAMILGIYDRLISSVSSFFKDVKKNFLFLLQFAIAGLAGIVLCARPITDIIDRFPIVSMFFFIGLVFGSVPMLCKKAMIDKVKPSHMLFFCIGAFIVIMMSFLPQMDAAAVSGMSFSTFLLQIVTGLVVAAGFILPGISTSYLLLLLGTYDFVMSAISQLDVLALVPFVLGFILGVILLTRVLEICMYRFPSFTYTLILGFLVGSVYTVYPGTPHGLEILCSAVSFVAGFIIIYLISSKEAQLDEKI